METKSLLTVKEVASILNCSPSTVYAKAGRGEIPSLKLGGMLRFDPAEIEEWIKKGRRKPADIDKLAKGMLKPSRQVDVDAVVRRAIDSVTGSGYNSGQGRPDRNQAYRKGGTDGSV